MSKSNSINAQIFYALKVSEESKVPFLFMSAPGMGKSTSVKWFAENSGYELETLRGNSTSEDEIMGYDVVDTTPGARSALHLIPDWFKRVKDNEKNGKKTLLFVDEITTCSDQVQSALLHLIFERKVHSDDLPKDTLVVAAGNYSQSLGNSFGLIPPLMNRFCIFNIIPDNDDIIPFLSSYGKKSTKVDVPKLLSNLTKNKKVVSPEIMNRIGEYLETGVRETTKVLQSPQENKIDIKVTDTQGIYNEVEGDGALMGFVTPRTLCYFRDVTISAYLCYGKDGILSSNYKRMIEGLVGLGLTRSKGSNSTVEKHNLVETYYNNIKQIIADLEKLENNKIAEYEKYFNDMVEKKDASSISYEDIIAINNKISELKKDKAVENIDRPLDATIVDKLCTVYVKKANVLKNMKTLDPQDLINGGTGCSIDEFTGFVSHWNSIADAFENLSLLIEDSKRNYNDSTKSVIKKSKKQIGDFLPRLRVMKSNFVRKDPATSGLIPEFHNKYING